MEMAGYGSLAPKQTMFATVHDECRVASLHQLEEFIMTKTVLLSRFRLTKGQHVNFHSFHSTADRARDFHEDI